MTPTTAPPRRNGFLATALEQIGCPYVWGADGQHLPDGDRQTRAFDCSGLVAYAMSIAGGPDWRKTHNSNRLWLELPPVKPSQLLPGDLAFYGVGSHATHVMIHMGTLDFVFGASGGNSDVTSIEVARKRGACVKVKPAGALYRKDLLGFRSLSDLLFI